MINPVKTPITVHYTLQGQAGGTAANYFGPLAPQAPSAPLTVAGRAWDFQAGFNLQLRPRENQPITFQTLRNLADGYDMVRLCIETRKDQMEAMSWNILPAKGVEPLPNQDARVKVIEKWLKRPDKELLWAQWLRRVIEEVLVTDALSIYVRRTRGGFLHSLPQIDGALVKRVIDPWGRTPQDGSPAYQQMLKGMPAVNYQAYSQESFEDQSEGRLPELIYSMRNARVHSPYGCSPVEQVIATINLGISRQAHQTAYFTEGNMPESLVGVPETWTVDQIREFQTYWDSLLAGEVAKRRRARFIPGGMNYQPTKDVELFGKAEEWIARVVCYAFSLSPQAFSPQMNRATSEQAAETAEDEGLIPLRNFVSGILNYVIEIEFNSPDLTFTWSDKAKLSEEKDRMLTIQEVKAGIVAKDEARVARGLRQIGTPEMALPVAAPEPKVGSPADEETDSGASFEATPPVKKAALAVTLAKADSIPWDTHPLGLSRPVAKRLEASVAEDLTPALEEAGTQAAISVTKALRTLSKDAGINWDTILSGKWADKIDAGIKAILDDLLDMAKDAGEVAANLVGYDNFNKVNEAASKLISARGAELVRMITDTTREGLKAIISKGLEDNICTKKIADLIQESELFSPSRAELIARTEISWANSNSSLESYALAKADGVKVKKSWLLGPNPCTVCQGNAAEGAIELEKAFSSGHQASPAHPNCVCAVSPVVED